MRYINTLTFKDGQKSVDNKSTPWTASKLLAWAKQCERKASATGLQAGGVAHRILNGDMPEITVLQEQCPHVAQIKRYVLLLELEAQGVALSKSSRVKRKYEDALAQLSA